jgi:V/A-type H+-transporting ATPase subunit I
MAAIVPILMAASIFLLFFREPIIHLLQGKKKLFPEGLVSGVMGGLVEILDIVLGFLANTVSFIRVAAFGLAHAGLFMAIFALSDLVKTSAHGIASALVLLFGNILIICLEGLVVSIQGVRLEFYEFFTRFFERGEAIYRPLKSELTV